MVSTDCRQNTACIQQGYEGDPFSGCRRTTTYECTINSDCRVDAYLCEAYKKYKPNPCGPNTECVVVNSIQRCTCKPGYTESIKTIQGCIKFDPPEPILSLCELGPCGDNAECLITDSGEDCRSNSGLSGVIVVSQTTPVTHHHVDQIQSVMRTGSDRLSAAVSEDIKETPHMQGIAGQNVSKTQTALQRLPA